MIFEEWSLTEIVTVFLVQFTIIICLALVEIKRILANRNNDTKRRGIATFTLNEVLVWTTIVLIIGVLLGIIECFLLWVLLPDILSQFDR